MWPTVLHTYTLQTYSTGGERSNLCWEDLPRTNAKNSRLITRIYKSSDTTRGRGNSRSSLRDHSCQGKYALLRSDFSCTATRRLRLAHLLLLPPRFGIHVWQVASSDVQCVGSRIDLGHGQRLAMSDVSLSLSPRGERPSTHIKQRHSKQPPPVHVTVNTR